MPYVERHTISVSLSTTGAATVLSPVIDGRIASVTYSTTLGDLGNTVDFTFTTEHSLQDVWRQSNVAASAVHFPVHATNLATSGAASALTETPVYMANERISFVFASGTFSATTNLQLVIVGTGISA